MNVGQPSRLRLPVGEVEGVLLGDLQRRDERAEARGQRQPVQQRGQPAAGGHDDPFGVERPAVAALSSRYPADVASTPATGQLLAPGRRAVGLLEQRAHRALGVDHPGAGVPEDLAVDGDLRPPRPGVGRAQQLVLDTDRVEDPGEGVDVADRPEVQRAGRGDQPRPLSCSSSSKPFLAATTRRT